MYGIFTYIWLISMVSVGKYAIHWVFGDGLKQLETHHPKICPSTATATNGKEIAALIKQESLQIHDYQDTPAFAGDTPPPKKHNIAKHSRWCLLQSRNDSSHSPKNKTHPMAPSTLFFSIKQHL